MYKFLLISASLILSVPVAAQQTDLIGTWKQTTGASTVKIAPCESGRDLCATVIAEEIKAGEPSMLNRVAVRDVRPAGQQRYVGTFVDENGGTLGAKIRQTAPDQLQLKICVLSFLCDTMKFVRQPSASK